ncbi:MAG: DoxX family membrane protein [Patescibacteria group bacterium]
MNYFDILFFIGRLLLGGYFIISGINHFTKLGMLEGYTQSKGVPMPKAAVIITGILLLLGGLGILLGVYVEWAILALVIFLVSVTFIMHAFWKVQEPNMRMSEMVHFMKNLALLGALLMLLSIPMWPYPLF